jgi:hypothetical protein
MIKRALENIEETKSLFSRLGFWGSKNQISLINKIKTHLEQQSLNGLQEDINLSSKELYNFIYLFMSHSMDDDRSLFLRSLAKTTPKDSYEWFKLLLTASQQLFFSGALTQANFNGALHKTAQQVAKPVEQIPDECRVVLS